MTYLFPDNNYLTALNTTNISVLDLSDNELLDLKEILSVLSTVKTLYSLSLDGNPCSVIAFIYTKTQYI